MHEGVAAYDGLSIERSLEGTDFIQYATKRPYVTCREALAIDDLFRRHVIRCPNWTLRLE